MAEPQTLEELRARWSSITSAEGRRDAAEAVALARDCLAIGAPLLAYDVASGILDSPTPDTKRWQRARIQLRQSLGLALARSGATQRARDVATALLADGHADGETLGLLARTHKDLWESAPDAPGAATELRAAHRVYRRAYRDARKPLRVDDAIYNGINAATTALLLGDTRTARSIGRQVEDLASRPSRRRDYWARATLGEAALLRGEVTQAESFYAEAFELAQDRPADRAAMRRQARLLLGRLDEDPARLDAVFRIPRVVVFAGHMIDQPGRSRPRFPAELEPRVRDALAAKLEELKAGVGFASGACGSDILFLEQMLERGGEINVVLPFSRSDFRATSVEVVPGEWGSRFDRVLAAARSVEISNERHFANSAESFDYCNRIQDGLAVLKAASLDTDLVAVAVWDRQPGDGPGGTAAFIEHWRRQRRSVHLLDIRKIRQPGVRLAAPVRKRRGARRSEKPERQVTRALLFADVVHYSQLAEDQIPGFVEHFMGAVARLIERPLHRPVAKNTWGDALYFVFRDVRRAALVALDLADWISGTDWRDHGLPADLNLRISLHAGPVFECRDPVIGKRTYTGSHVSQAARIEPITPPGLVYASRACAALAASEGVSEVAFDYVGRIPLAKKYGEFPMYHVRRRSA